MSSVNKNLDKIIHFEKSVVISLVSYPYLKIQGVRLVYWSRKIRKLKVLNNTELLPISLLICSSDTRQYQYHKRANLTLAT